MEDEVDYSFLTQTEYEEALMDEHISEEVVYQEFDQGGYSLRSRMIAPPKKNVVPAKQPTALAKKVTVPPKMMVVIPKQLQKPINSTNSDLSNSRLQYKR